MVMEETKRGIHVPAPPAFPSPSPSPFPLPFLPLLFLPCHKGDAPLNTPRSSPVHIPHQRVVGICYARGLWHRVLDGGKEILLAVPLVLDHPRSTALATLNTTSILTPGGSQFAGRDRVPLEVLVPVVLQGVEILKLTCATSACGCRGRNGQTRRGTLSPP